MDGGANHRLRRHRRLGECRVCRCPPPIRSPLEARSPTSFRRSPRSATSTTGRRSSGLRRAARRDRGHHRDQDDAPTFENTMVAARAERPDAHRVADVFFNKSSADSSDFTNELEEEIAPAAGGARGRDHARPALYWRGSRPSTTSSTSLGLDAGAALPRRALLHRDHARRRGPRRRARRSSSRNYNQQLSTLTTRFEKNLLADTNELAVVVDDAAELDGLDAGEVSAAAEAAKERGLDGKYLVTLVLPTGHPYLAALTNRDVRETHHGGVARARHPRRRARQPRARARDRAAAGRARAAARLRHATPPT